MRYNGAFKKIAYVTFSNVIKLSSSILIAFVIPSILGLTGYGYYKTFTLYLTYIGLFHFGFIDGIYLKYGGTTYEALVKEDFRLYTRFLLLVEFCVSLLGILFTVFFIEGEKKVIFLLLFLNLVIVNMTTFYQVISQMTSRFKEYSIRTILLSAANIIILAIFYFLGLNDYRIYISLLIASNFILLFWYVHTYKDITFGSKLKTTMKREDILYFFKTGVPLLLANLASTLVLTVDKQIVEIFFPVEIFGVYSFAYSMLAMITVVVSAISMVLYPILKRTKVDNIKTNYSNLNRIMILFVLFGLIGYFPLLLLVPKILPDYVNSLVIFRIALPGLAFTSSISAIKHNFYKVTNNNFPFFVIGCIAICLNIGLNLGSYLLFGTTESIAISTIFGIIIWYVTTDIYFWRKYRVHWKLNFLILLAGISAFYCLTSINDILLSGFLYAVVVLLLICLNYKTLYFFFVHRN